MGALGTGGITGGRDTGTADGMEVWTAGTFTGEETGGGIIDSCLHNSYSMFAPLSSFVSHSPWKESSSQRSCSTAEGDGFKDWPWLGVVVEVETGACGLVIGVAGLASGALDLVTGMGCLNNTGGFIITAGEGLIAWASTGASEDSWEET